MVRDWDKGRSDFKDCVPVSAPAVEVPHQTPPKRETIAISQLLSIVSFCFVESLFMHMLVADPT